MANLPVDKQSQLCQQSTYLHLQAAGAAAAAGLPPAPRLQTAKKGTTASMIGSAQVHDGDSAMLQTTLLMLKPVMIYIVVHKASV
jgi:hypothetical protein